MHDELKNILVGDLKLTASRLLPNATLTEAGFDSLAVVELSVLLRDRYGIDVTETEIRRTTSLLDLELFVEREREAAQMTAGDHPRADGGAR